MDYSNPITNNHVSSNKGFLEDGPLDGANMRPRKNEQKKEKRLSYAEAHREEFERPKSQIRKVSHRFMSNAIWLIIDIREFLGSS